jgi:hypothetical protein
MKLLGRGWQYSVYDLGNGRVIKKHNSRLTAYLVMLKACFPYIKHPIWKFSEYYQSIYNNAVDSMRKIQATHLNMKLFGNPKILENGYEYEQDISRSIDLYVANINLEEGKKIIDKFIQLNHLLVENNLIDKSFNMGRNFGVNQNGEVILIDLGELYSNPDNIKKQISKKMWRESYVLNAVPKKLQAYFLEQMDKNFYEK